MGGEEDKLPPGYPVGWEADVVLSDGGTARLRPIRPDDASMLVNFYARVSPESKYLRFFAPYPRLSDADVHRFTHVDYVDRVAFIVTVGEEMIAVGRYDRVEDDKAEVAFLVQDADQGRGVAQLLLEHLAQAARERGITGFFAEVLPQNRRMAQVFADAGYRVSKGIQDGVLLVEFPILPTDTSVGVMERREHRAEGTSVRRLLKPRRVALYGPGARVQELVGSLVCGGFRGEVVAVSSDGREVHGVPTARSLATVDGSIDLVVASIGANEMGAVVIDSAHKGAHGIVVLTGTDTTAADSHTLVSLARAYGIRAVGPDSLGLINTSAEVYLNATPAPMPRPGGVGIFCQSAAVGVALVRGAAERGLGLSSFFSSGGFADVTGNDVMQYWEDDDSTRVCVLALESIGNPRKFSRIIRRLGGRKPVIVFSPGRLRRESHAGNRGGLGHAPDQAVDSLFRQSGVLVAHRREEVLDLAAVLARMPLPTGPRVRILSNSATQAEQAVHGIRAAGLLATEPVVLFADAPAEAYVSEAGAALADPACDSVVCGVVAPFDGGRPDVRAALETVAGSSTKPIVGVLLDFAEPPDHDPGPDLPGGMPSFRSPGDAAQALVGVTGYARWRERDPGAVPLLEVDEAAAHRVVNRVLADDPAGRPLTEEETCELLAAYGVAVVPRRPVHTLDEAVTVGRGFGWDVVLKATSPAVRGRPDVASVYRHIGDEHQMADAWAELGLLVAEIGLDSGGVTVAEPVVQPMVPAGVALEVASREDAAFGPILSVGLSGIASELLLDVAYRVPPLTTADAALMVRDLRAAPTLFGRDGSPAANVAAVEDLLHRVAQLADALPQLSELVLNPCIASRAEVGVVGARVVVAPTRSRRDPLARALG